MWLHARAAAAMTKMRLELLGYDALPLEGMYHSQRHDVLTPQSSPESRSVRQEQRSSSGSVGSAISQSDMYPLDQPTFELDHLPLHIPTILHCKCRRTMHRETVDYLSPSSSLLRASATLNCKIASKIGSYIFNSSNLIRKICHLRSELESLIIFLYEFCIFSLTQ